MMAASQPEQVNVFVIQFYFGSFVVSSSLTCSSLINLKIGRYCIELITWQRMAENTRGNNHHTWCWFEKRGERDGMEFRCACNTAAEIRQVQKIPPAKLLAQVWYVCLLMTFRLLNAQTHLLNFIYRRPCEEH